MNSHARTRENAESITSLVTLNCWSQQERTKKKNSTESDDELEAVDAEENIESLGDTEMNDR